MPVTLLCATFFWRFYSNFSILHLICHIMPVFQANLYLFFLSLLSLWLLPFSTFLDRWILVGVQLRILFPRLSTIPIIVAVTLAKSATWWFEHGWTARIEWTPRWRNHIVLRLVLRQRTSPIILILFTCCLLLLFALLIIIINILLLKFVFVKVTVWILFTNANVWLKCRPEKTVRSTVTHQRFSLIWLLLLSSFLDILLTQLNLLFTANYLLFWYITLQFFLDQGSCAELFEHFFYRWRV